MLERLSLRLAVERRNPEMVLSSIRDEALRLGCMCDRPATVAASLLEPAGEKS